MQGLEIVSVEWQPNPAGGPPKFAEVPGSERVIEADLCMLAMGFLGPADALGELEMHAGGLWGWKQKPVLQAFVEGAWRGKVAAKAHRQTLLGFNIV